MSLSPRAIGPFRYSLLDNEPFYETRMSLLWLADVADQQQREQKRVVLKIARLKEEEFSLANERAINNEERWLRRLQHPGIIKLRPIAEEGKTRPGQEIYRARSTFPGNPWFVVTDYLPGGTLQALVQERKKLNVILALQIARYLADTLIYIHSKGCIHQDFKPRNILFAQTPQQNITEQSRPILIDFGIAGQQGDQQSLSGTRPWLPPESDRAHRTGDKLAAAPSMDIYALGVVLYFMLTGKRPPEAIPNIAVHLQISAGECVGLTDRNTPSALARINHLITACVQDDPSRRPTSRQVHQELEAILQLLQKSLLQQLLHWSPWHASVTGGGVILLALLFYNFFWSAGTEGANNGNQAESTPTPSTLVTIIAPAVLTATTITTATVNVPIVQPTLNTPSTDVVGVPMLTATTIAVPTATATVIITMTATLPPTVRPTSTLAPTATSTHTPTPRPPTFTPTPRPATPTPQG